MIKIEDMIIYEDNHLMVVTKPYNMPVQEDESKDEDLLTSLKKFIKERDNKPNNVFVGLVHRLDRPTGGVMVFAKTSKAASRLSEQIKQLQMTKKYLAVVFGEPKLKRATLKNYLMKDEANNKVMVVPSARLGAKEAILTYEVLETKENLSLISVDLETGRSHQIRVQMANIGNSVIGDLKYGIKTKTKMNMALWAYNLKFYHPVTKELLNFIVYPPVEDKVWYKFNINGLLAVKNVTEE